MEKNLLENYEEICKNWTNDVVYFDENSTELANENFLKLIILFSYESLKIENDEIDLDLVASVFKDGYINNYTGKLVNILEIANAKNVCEMCKKAIINKHSMNESLLRNFHYETTLNTYTQTKVKAGERPGDYKHSDYLLLERGSIGALPEDVKEEVDELLFELTEVEDNNALTAAAYFHAKFENIHPFADGSGRVGRIMINYFLIMHNHPPIIFYSEDKEKYFECLESWNLYQDIEPLKEFLIYQTVKTHDSYEKIISEK